MLAGRRSECMACGSWSWTAENGRWISAVHAYGSGGAAFFDIYLRRTGGALRAGTFDEA